MGGWIVSTVNEGISYGAASLLVIKQAPTVVEGVYQSLSGGAGMWFGSLVGASATLFAVFKKCGLRALDNFEKYAVGTSCLGWIVLLCSSNGVLSGAIILQSVSLIAGYLFYEAPV